MKDVELTKDFYTIRTNLLIDRLANIYKQHSKDIAVVCDEVLDRSGSLLSYVRDRASQIYIPDSSIYY